MTLRTKRMATFYAQLLALGLCAFGAGATLLNITQPDRAIEREFGR